MSPPRPGRPRDLLLRQSNLSRLNPRDSRWLWAPVYDRRPTRRWTSVLECQSPWKSSNSQERMYVSCEAQAARTESYCTCSERSKDRPDSDWIKRYEGILIDIAFVLMQRSTSLFHVYVCRLIIIRLPIYCNYRYRHPLFWLEYLGHGSMMFTHQRITCVMSATCRPGGSGTTFYHHLDNKHVLS